MISFRQILVIILVVGLIWLFSYLRRRFHAQFSHRSTDQNYSDMVRCQYCGVYTLRKSAQGNAEIGYSCSDPQCLTSRKKI